MEKVIETVNCAQDLLDKVRRAFEFTGPLALRIYLAPIFIYAGINKLTAAEDVAFWFASLGIPAPTVMAYAAGVTELVGGVFLLVGLATRWAALPLMVTMVIAAVTAHWENGWHVLPETQLTVPWEWRMDMIEGAVERKRSAVSILKQHGDYAWLTEHGGITILKNGIEFTATYFVMLLALFFLGAGKYFSIDYWLARQFRPTK